MLSVLTVLLFLALDTNRNPDHFAEALRRILEELTLTAQPRIGLFLDVSCPEVESGLTIFGDNEAPIFEVLQQRPTDKYDAYFSLKEWSGEGLTIEVFFDEDTPCRRAFFFSKGEEFMETIPAGYWNSFDCFSELDEAPILDDAGW
ncbi:MAG: hypothetical protein H8E15_05370 [Planctomycetes bacterium]|nr:hypothetical protein [Planctomycetota bacterium]